ncbi:hypothetical protein E2C01_023077 [Portunus trituberculatus]|uniref:Uncharacterized protein n=1 Tax=Portunus trituberculatus TaxID=210409 RepID=A0A5B7E9F9_PORTR|nr:hypothetical protein [Portunus trituberculatus]
MIRLDSAVTKFKILFGNDGGGGGGVGKGLAREEGVVAVVGDGSGGGGGGDGAIWVVAGPLVGSREEQTGVEAYTEQNEIEWELGAAIQVIGGDVRGNQVRRGSRESIVRGGGGWLVSLSGLESPFPNSLGREAAPTGHSAE